MIDREGALRNRDGKGCSRRTVFKVRAGWINSYSRGVERRRSDSAIVFVASFPTPMSDCLLPYRELLARILYGQTSAKVGMLHVRRFDGPRMLKRACSELAHGHRRNSSMSGPFDSHLQDSVSSALPHVFNRRCSAEMSRSPAPLAFRSTISRSHSPHKKVRGGLSSSDGKDSRECGQDLVQGRCRYLSNSSLEPPLGYGADLKAICSRWFRQIVIFRNFNLNDP